MSRSFATSLLALALAVVPAAALARGHVAPTPVPSVAPTPTTAPENPAITTLARREFVAWQAGSVDASHYADQTRAKLSPAKIAATSKALAALGALVKVDWLGYLGIHGGPPGVTGYIYRMHCTYAAVYEELTIAADGKIDGIIFRDKLQR